MLNNNLQILKKIINVYEEKLSDKKIPLLDKNKSAARRIVDEELTRTFSPRVKMTSFLLNHNIAIRTMHKQKGNFAESLRIEKVDFDEIKDLSWEESQIFQSISKKVFLVFGYTKKNSEICFDELCVIIFNRPMIEKFHKETFDRCKVLINDKRIKLSYKSLPTTQALSEVAHLRPHAQNRSNVYKDGPAKGIVKLAYWLNNDLLNSSTKIPVNSKINFLFDL